VTLVLLDGVILLDGEEIPDLRSVRPTLVDRLVEIFDAIDEDADPSPNLRAASRS
jgi:hypothetical protein